MTINNCVKAVIFDIDGLMLDTQRIATKVWQNAVSFYGYTLSEEDNLMLIGRNIKDSTKILYSLFGSDFPIKKVQNHARQNFFIFMNENGIPLKPGLIELLNFLDKQSVPAAVATSTSRDDCVMILDKCDLTHRFKIIVCGNEVQSGKPKPDLFLKAAGLLQVPPQSCIVLEDSFAGIRAAHSADMISIMVPDLLAPDDEMISLAHAVVPTLNEARLEIEKLLRN